MRVYVGQTRSRSLIARLEALGFGECCNRGEFPPRRRPWFQDNGAFSDWRSGRDFDAAAFLRDCSFANAAPSRPDFSVCPDRVATGLDSLAFSLRWLDSYGSAFPALRWYLAVQDGMTAAHVEPVAHRFAGLFVGGSLPWKLATGEQWVRDGHRWDMPVHVGRVGTPRRVRWAQRIGADSIDSCLPLWSEENLARFVGALDAKRRQAELPW